MDLNPSLFLLLKTQIFVGGNGLSSTENCVLCSKVSTRKGFVDKKAKFLVQSVDEKRFRRQKCEIFGLNCRREKVSSRVVWQISLGKPHWSRPDSGQMLAACLIRGFSN